MPIGRRDFLKGAAGLAAGAALPARVAANLSGDQAAPRRPNILVFLTDDHGHWLQGSYGNSEVRTPNLDRLARRGVRMTNASTPSPVCSPARASFFTGMFPSQHGIHDWIEESTNAYASPWLEGQTLISERLRDSGYHTGLVGKWHCGFEREPRPGFDYWFSYWVSQYPHRGEQKFSDQGRQVIEQGQQSPLLTNHALDFLRQHRDDSATAGKPFFLCVGYVDTHGPHANAPDDLVAEYADATFRDIPQEEFSSAHGKASVTVNKDPAIERAKRQQYYAAASSIDREMGRVIADLEAHGELDNTLVVYTGDHGLNAGHHGVWEKGNITQPQNFLDESIRVPCTISWPSGGLGRDVTSAVPVDHCDLHATLLDAAGLDAAGVTPSSRVSSPGRSYLPLLRGERISDWRDAQICEYGNARMIRTQDYKLIRRYPFKGVADSHELYDLRSDPRETANRYADPSLSGVIDTLTDRLNAFFAKYEVAVHSGLSMEDQPLPTPASPWLRKSSRSFNLESRP
ncbi:MAG: sulfatase-like hydrolase/transferase [Acidobacteria bacterium]|nr:sulfatase-like hydrolase/transferase [Acidobacteriota bacterium]